MRADDVRPDDRSKSGESLASSSSSPLPSLELSLIGFCGVDDTVCPRRLLEISLEYSFVEWGVLFREDKQGTPRYPSWEWLQTLVNEVEKKIDPRSKNQTNQFNKDTTNTGTRDKYKMCQAIRLAGHLCGNYAKRALEGDTTFVRKLVEKFGFLRIQLNPTKINGVNLTRDIQTYAPSLKTLFAEFPQVEFIIQVNSETSKLAYILMDDPTPNTAFLFDSSMGMGKVPAIRPPPVLHPGVHCGYAGGLGPNNLHEELVKIAEAVCSSYPQCARPVWVDMESSLRSIVENDDVFDLNQTLECIQVIFDLGLKGEEDCGVTDN